MRFKSSSDQALSSYKVLVKGLSRAVQLVRKVAAIKRQSNSFIFFIFKAVFHCPLWTM